MWLLHWMFIANLLGIFLIGPHVGLSFFCVVGFAFILKTVHDTEMADLVGGGELIYQNVSLGVCQKAINWIKEKEVIFGMDQSHLIFKRLIRFFNRGLING